MNLIRKLLFLFVGCLFLIGCNPTLVNSSNSKNAATLTMGGWQKAGGVFLEPYKCENFKMLSFNTQFSPQTLAMPSNKLFTFMISIKSRCDFVISFYPLPNQNYIADIGFLPGTEICQVRLYRKGIGSDNTNTLYPVNFFRREFTIDPGFLYANKYYCADRLTYIKK